MSASASTSGLAYATNSSADKSETQAKQGTKRKAGSSTLQSEKSVNTPIRKLTDEQFYELVKEKCQPTNDNIDVNNIDESVKNNADDVWDQIKHFDNIKDIYLSKGMNICCLLGRNFLILKKELKLKNTEINRIFEQNLGKRYGYSKSQRYFCMAMYELSKEYGKVKNISLPYSDIRIRLGYLKERIKNDKDFNWKL